MILLSYLPWETVPLKFRVVYRILCFFHFYGLAGKWYIKHMHYRLKGMVSP